MTVIRTTWAWWLAGLGFALYPALRPYGDEPTLSGLAAFAGSRWLVAHLLGMAAFALLPVAARQVGAGAGAGPGAGTRRTRANARAVALAYAGVVGLLPYYGGEAFGLHAVGAYAVATGDVGLVAVVDGFRYQPVAITLFGLGLVAVAAAGVLVWWATRGAGRPWRVATGVVALALVLYLPQFFAAPGVRIAHGVVLGAGCWAVAALATRSPRQGSSTSLPRT